jgi:hypothetical protein
MASARPCICCGLSSPEKLKNLDTDGGDRPVRISSTSVNVCLEGVDMMLAANDTVKQAKYAVDHGVPPSS